MRSLAGKTLFITGASRGIGKAIGIRAAKDGANVVIAAKTTRLDPRLEGTIFTAAEEMIAADGKALPVACDVRDEEQVRAAVAKAVETFGGIDILVNNASAINLSGTMDLPLSRFDLMFQVNARATFLCSKTCMPHLLKAANPHVLTLSPPLNTDAKWFKGMAPYTMTKYGMTMVTLGLSREFKSAGLGANALWPKTGIATAAVRNILGGEEAVRHCRKPEIVADAAWFVLSRESRGCSGNCFIDEEVLREEGVQDLTRYAVDPKAELPNDFFV